MDWKAAVGMVMQDSASLDLASAVERAAARLVTTRHRPNESFVNVPFFYPSGAAATVRVANLIHGFRVSDCGLAYREAEMVGGEASFARRAKRVADD
ncbi:MAG TPA: hypothetical protein VN697_09730, partial [Tepidiformaceae bacterium]|nr:hypothetical protein [Tepidiformaceae bacterium]